MLDNGKSVSLAKSRYKADTAQTVYKTCKHIEASQRNADPLPESVTAWIGNAPDGVRQKLQKAGLIVIPEVVTVGELFERFLVTDRSVKDATMDTYQWAGRRFFAHFSPEIDIAEITRENIEEWRDESLKKTQKLASATERSDTVTLERHPRDDVPCDESQDCASQRRGE